MIDIGSVVNGKYRLKRLLGDGGMGAVYEAEHAGLGTRVAIKVLHPELARRTGLVERFLQEARVAAQIRSPHVVQVTDVDRTPEGQAYIVMELLEGEPLSSVLDRQRKLSPAVASEYTLQILQALEAAHALGVIHRDLKPENVFVTFPGGGPVLKLIDFGIAKARPTDPQQRNLTVAGVVMGTAEYMAPEQARSADKVDARADLYAVGVMIYEMLSGARPVSGDDARVVALKVERGEVVPLVQAAPDVPRELAGLVHRAMAARPELRFASATEMRLALEAISGRGRPATAAMMAAGGALGPAGTGTLKNVSAQQVFGAPGSSAPDPSSARRSDLPVATLRAPPIATALVAGAAGGYAPGPTDGRSAASQGSLVHLGVPFADAPRPQRRGRTLVIVALSVLVGASAVVVLVATGAWQSSPPPQPDLVARPAPPPEASAASSGAGAASATTAPAPPAIPSLLATRPVQAQPAARPSPSARPSPASDDAAAQPQPAQPFAFPSALPTTLPSTLPPFPSVLPPFPAGFPTTFPTVLPPWPAPPPSAAPAPSH